MASTATATPRTGARVHVQRFGTFLSNMILPNIAAFIAWGFITALFIQAGWITLVGDKIFGYVPGLEDGQYDYGFVSALGGWDADGGGIVGPMITYLLPILIGYTGGRMIYNDSIRGGVVGAIATMGAITAASVPMFLGAMVMGPLGGYTMKRIDALWAHKIKPGFEMLVNNFSAGIWGMILALFGFAIAGPFVEAFSNLAENVVDFLVDNSLLPLTSIFVEPAKILFLNNAINHGVFTPLGTQEAVEQGPVDPVPDRGQPRPRRGPVAGLHVLRQGTGQGDGPRRAGDPVLRRHPRDLLPVRPDEAEADPGRDPRRHDGSGDQPALRLRPARPGGARLDHRGVAAGTGVQPGRGDLVGAGRRRGLVLGRRDPAEARQVAGRG